MVCGIYRRREVGCSVENMFRHLIPESFVTCLPLLCERKEECPPSVFAYFGGQTRGEVVRLQPVSHRCDVTASAPQAVEGSALAWYLFAPRCRGGDSKGDPDEKNPEARSSG